MLRSCQQFRNKQNLEKDTLKQKKRLSFKEPEVEGSRVGSSGSKPKENPQSKTFSSWTTKENDLALSRSLEDLSLEDQTISIAHNIGKAFENRVFEKIAPEKKRLSLVSTGPLDLPHLRKKPGILVKEPTQHEKSLAENNLNKTKSAINTSFKLSPEDEGYLEALSPPITDMEAMKYPVFELNESSWSQTVLADRKQELPDKVATSIQHQMQYLKFQLDHQHQQTQAALAHIQLLKDQLQAETSARYKAQVQNQQLIMNNKDLLNRIQGLFQQIQGLEKHIESLGKKSSNDSSSQEIQFRRKDSSVNESVVRGNGTNQGTKISAFAPNPIIANRRSSMTGLKPFQSKIDFSDPSKKREEIKLHIEDATPAVKNLSGNTLFSDLKADSKSPAINSIVQERSLKTNTMSSKRNSFAGYDQFKTVINESYKKPMNCMLNCDDEGSNSRENPLLIEESTHNRASYHKKTNSEPEGRNDHNNTYLALPSTSSCNNWSQHLRLFDDNTSTMQKANDNQQKIKENPRFSYASDSLQLFSN